MAMTKPSSAITQLTASGTSTTLTIGVSSIFPVIPILHSNGTGSVTVAATAQVQYQLNGAVRWYAPAGLLLTFSTTAAASENRVVTVPDAATAVRIVYTAPTGPTGFTLDAELGVVTP